MNFLIYGYERKLGLNKPIEVMIVFGTRPEAIKLAPLILELKKRPTQFRPFIAVTAQHRQMLDQALGIFNIVPDFDLNLMKDRQTLTEVTVRAIEGLDALMQSKKPDLVLVHGDTTTTFAASLAAYYNHIPLGHVEAGLRTWKKQSPFPEEMNRQLTGVLADLHFAPTQQARMNLLAEGKKEEDIYVTGNTAIDTLQTTIDSSYTHPLLEEISSSRIILMTTHRRENLGYPMEEMFKAIKQIADTHEDVQVVFPVHLNPLIQKSAAEILENHPRIQLIPPLDVRDFHNFAFRSYFIMTDSGGVQEEAPSLGVPVLVLRDTTERPEGIAAGTLKLAGTKKASIYHMAHKLLTDPDLHQTMAEAANPYGDGKASVRIAEAILYHFNQRLSKPASFTIS